MELTQIGALLAVSVVLAALGQGVSSMVFRGFPQKAGTPGWRGVFYVTMWAHPILVGALLGVPDWLPAPHFMGDHLVGRVMWFALAGVLSSTVYDAVVSFIKHKAADGFSFARRTTPVPVRPPAGEDAGPSGMGG